jgi:hypothetical protein
MSGVVYDFSEYSDYSYKLPNGLGSRGAGIGNGSGEIGPDANFY